MNTRPQRTIIVLLALCALALLAFGVSCAALAPTKPTVVITAPASGTRVNAGTEAAVQSTATDAQGIARVELWVDGAVVRSDALPAPQTAYTVIQRWTATTPGAHVIQVRAYNTAGAASDPAFVSIEVVGAPTTAGGLVPATAIPPGQSPVSPGGAVAPPTLTSTVPRPVPTTPPTSIPTATKPQPPPPPACPGPPVITSVFTANPATITAGQSTTLSWGKVDNATSVTIDPGIGGVATPDSRVVKPDKTTTYTLTATGCGGTITKQVTVTANPAPATTALLILTGKWGSPQWGEMTFMHNTNNNQVVGLYTWDDGSLDGVFVQSTRRMDFRWWEKARGKTYYDQSDPRERGVGYLVISEDSKTLTGKWRYESTPEGKWDGDWTATRK
ncbi:MAG: hypothetical protein FJ009_12120 [Chloroflexi bacterium]|nr:hypothetical protein [Chloroflexota bacterium]